MTARRLIDLLVDLPDFPNAACKDIDHADVFFPSPGHRGRHAVEAAQAICSGCPDRVACLKWAMSNHVEGVWGGMSYAQRRKAKR